MSCVSRYNVIQYDPCGPYGSCVNGTCVCHDGATMVEDWHTVTVCKVVTRNLNIAMGVVSGMALIAMLGCLYKFRLLWLQVQNGANHKRTPAYITALMSVPPMLICIYGIVALLTSVPTLKDQWSLCIVYIILNIVWSISGAVINRWLIGTVANAMSFSNPQAKIRARHIIHFIYAVLILQTVAVVTLIIVLRTTGWQYTFRAYAIVMTLYVMTYVFPYYYSKLMERDVESHIKSQDIRKQDQRMHRLHQNMTAVRQSFAGTAIYMVNAVFAIVIELSPYYLVVTFIIGVIFALGCYRIFPDGVEDHDDSGGSNIAHTSAMSDAMTGATQNSETV